MKKFELWHGDCLELMKNIPDGSVDLVLTDPPYVIETSGGGLYKSESVKYNKEIEFMKNGFSEKVLEEICRIMKKINVYFFCSQKQIPILLDFFVNKKKCNWNLISWHKTNVVPACGNKYLTDTEYILFFREKGVRVYGTYETKKTYYVTPTNQKEKKLYGHPTIKPQEILNNLIVNSTKENEVVFDGFMGSGSTGVACVNTNRHFIGIELDEGYFNIAKKRIEEAVNDIP